MLLASQFDLECVIDWLVGKHARVVVLVVRLMAHQTVPDERPVDDPVPGGKGHINHHPCNGEFGTECLAGARAHTRTRAHGNTCT